MNKFKNLFVVLQAETPVHVGIGQVDGAVDLPVAREATTHYPVIPGSGVKGAFRDWAAPTDLKGQEKKIFGAESNDMTLSAGGLIVSDARLLLLPIRATTDTFRLATCPHILSRLNRDLERLKRTLRVEIPKVTKGSYLGAGDTYIGLEERVFKREEGAETLVKSLKSLTARNDLSERLVVLSDSDFAWFARYGLAISAHNKLDDNKVSENLWYEESLPEETVMTLALLERDKGIYDKIAPEVVAHPYIQMGGNETTGQGWFKMSLHNLSGPEVSNG